jgi:predicted secreted protein with PEFG-CTERM motif
MTQSLLFLLLVKLLMNSKTTTFFLILTIIATGLVATIPAVSAETMVSVPAGSSVPGCEETDKCYIPYEVKVAVGETVTWSNDDTAAHTVTAGSAVDGVSGEFDSSLFMAATTFSHTFEKEGTFPYFCMVHPWMEGAVMVGAGSVGNGEELMVEITTGDAAQDEMLSIDVTFKTIDGMGVEHVNYDIMATQGTEVVLDDKGVHDHDGIMNHMTAPLPIAASSEMPVDITVTFNGFGVEGPFTGPIGQVATKQVVPEFGTIAAMILAVAIISIIAISAKSKLSIMPRL